MVGCQAAHDLPKLAPTEVVIADSDRQLVDVLQAGRPQQHDAQPQGVDVTRCPRLTDHAEVGAQLALAALAFDLGQRRRCRVRLCRGGVGMHGG